MKQIANTSHESAKCSKVKKSTNNVTKVKTVCDECCQIKPDSKKQYDMTRCVQCTIWFHDICVGIEKGEPVGLWMCKPCRDVPQTVKSDVIGLKNDVKQLMENTDSILAAVNGLSSQLNNCVSGLQDQINALSKQIKSRDKTLSDTVDTLTSATNKIKTSVEEKSNKILNKTNTVIEKVKSQTEIVETVMNNTKVTLQNNNSKNQSNGTKIPVNKQSGTTINGNTEKFPQTQKPKYKNPTQNPKPKNKTDQGSKPGQNTIAKSLNDNETIDLTTDSKKTITQSTLLVGSSILKGIKTKDLQQNATVRSFPGARTDTICNSLSKYDISNCETIILHVGGNDADRGVDMNTFTDNYVSLLNSLDAENRRIIVSGLLPRESVDLKPYNDTLKDICNENDITFVDNYDSFLLASGEMPDSYFHADKLHLKMSGSQKLLSNIDKVQSVRSVRKSSNDQTLPSHGLRHKGSAVVHKHKSRVPSQKFCHICSMNGHFTRDCWYNGRSMPLATYSSF